jgi:DNA-binding transcriptional ArsR family regulator
MVSQVFGLREWPRSKPLRDSGHFTELIKSVPMRKRDTRLVGRSGSSQLILSNPDLEGLVVQVFKAIGSPADVRTIRQLVLSKIPLQDYNVASLDEQLISGNDGARLRREVQDTRATPEDALLRGEQDDRVALMADDFLVSLRRAVNNNNRRYNRLLATLWHCYYNPAGPSQLEIAGLLGVSDSLVSDNRRLIEHELKKLKLTVDEAAIFSESLQRLVSESACTSSNNS